MSAEGDFATLANVVIAGAAAFTGWAAYKALGTWRDQMQGQANFDTARALARAAYNLRDALYATRRRGHSFHEYPVQYQNLPRVEWTARDEQAVYTHIFEGRVKKLTEAAIDYETSALEAETLWGPETKASSKPLLSSTNGLIMGIQSYLEGLGIEDFPDPIAKAIAFGTPTDDSPMTEDINKAMSKIEGLVVEHLRRS